MIRCRAHFQGDKCRLSLNHEGAHASPFHSWIDGDKTDELKPLSLKLAEKDQRRLLRMEPSIRARMFPVWLMALKNCEKYLKEAFHVRNERRSQRKVESPVEGPQA